MTMDSLGFNSPFLIRMLPAALPPAIREPRESTLSSLMPRDPHSVRSSTSRTGSPGSFASHLFTDRRHGMHREVGMAEAMG